MQTIWRKLVEMGNSMSNEYFGQMENWLFVPVAINWL
jgi:hypothetical protein